MVLKLIRHVTRLSLDIGSREDIKKNCNIVKIVKFFLMIIIYYNIMRF